MRFRLLTNHQVEVQLPHVGRTSVLLEAGCIVGPDLELKWQFGDYGDIIEAPYHARPTRRMEPLDAEAEAAIASLGPVGPDPLDAFCKDLAAWKTATDEANFPLKT